MGPLKSSPINNPPSQEPIMLNLRKKTASQQKTVISTKPLSQNSTAGAVTANSTDKKTSEFSFRLFIEKIIYFIPNAIKSLIGLFKKNDKPDLKVQNIANEALHISPLAGLSLNASSTKAEIQQSLAGIQIDSNDVEFKSSAYPGQSIKVPEQFAKDLPRYYYTLMVGEGLEKVLVDIQGKVLEPKQRDLILYNALLSYTKALSAGKKDGEQALKGLGLIMNQSNMLELTKSVIEKVSNPQIEMNDLKHHVKVDYDTVRIDITLDFLIRSLSNPMDIVGYIAVKREINVTIDDLAKNWQGVNINEVAPSLTVSDTLSEIKENPKEARKSIGVELMEEIPPPPHWEVEFDPDFPTPPETHPSYYTYVKPPPPPEGPPPAEEPPPPDYPHDEADKHFPPPPPGYIQSGG